MKREDLVKKFAEGVNQINGVKVKLDEAKEILEVIENITFDAIASEEEVPFKFGKIGGKTVPARDGVNPATGE